MKQKADRGQDRTKQGQRPDDGRRVRHLGLDVAGAVAAEPVRLKWRLLVSSPAIPARAVGGGGRVAGALLPSDRVETEVGGQGHRGQPGRLDGVEVPVHPRLVPRLPLPAVDLGRARREGPHLSVDGRLRPAHRVHEQAPGQAQRKDRGSSRVCPEGPPNAAHPAHGARILGRRLAIGHRMAPSSAKGAEHANRRHGVEYGHESHRRVRSDRAAGRDGRRRPR